MAENRGGDAAPWTVTVETESTAAGGYCMYERYARSMPIGAFEHTVAAEEACRACPRHGKNFACPPHSPAFGTFAEDTASALVLALRVPVDAQVEPGADPERATYRLAVRILTDELLRWRRQGYQVAGAGPCRACVTCTAETGEGPCRTPELRIYSLESLGINVIDLCQKTFRFDLEWSGKDEPSGFIAAVGAVLEAAAQT